MLFGWDAGVLVAFAAPVLIQLTEHRPLIRIAYNGSVFACAAAMGGLFVSFISGGGTDALVAKVGVSALTQYGAQPRADLTRRRRDGEAAVLRADLRQPAIDDVDLHADGICSARARRALAALAAALGRARRPAACDRSLPALDVPRAPRDEARSDRSADRAREPSPFPRTTRARAAGGRTERRPLQPLPHRRGRLQAHQRPLRPSRGRQRPLAARDGAAPERRSIPVGRRRVRAAPARLDRGGRRSRPRPRSSSESRKSESITSAR